MATLTVYSSAADGEIQISAKVTYALAHDELTGETVVDGGQAFAVGQNYSTVTGFTVNRGGLFFDTSSLPDSCTITAATLTLTCGGAVSRTHSDLTVVSGADIGASLVVGDFGDLLSRTISYGATTTDGWATDTAKDIIINAAGLATISKTGVTKWGLRTSRDISNTTPDIDGTNNGEYIFIWASEETETGTGAYRPKLVITYYTGAFPSDAVARVSSIRHICLPGSCRMQVGVGALGFDIDVVESSVRLALETAKETKPSYMPPPELTGYIPPTAVTAPLPEPPPRVTMRAVPPGPMPAPATSPPEVGELTDYAKRILETPGAKALQTRISGLKQGVEAVVTPHAIDVLRNKPQGAKILMQIQDLTTRASSTNITSYTRTVLIKQIIKLKQQLKSLYGGG